jgi:ABC-type branched-subunit amino acid transport system substrate-binding protein
MRATTASVIPFLRWAFLSGCAAALAACAAPQAGGGGAAAPGQQVQRAAPVGGADTVALLAPFSGRDAAMQAQARDLEAAARMALAEAGSTLTLKAYDTGAEPARAAAALTQAAAEGADVVIGPFYALEAQAVAAPAQQTGLTALAFTPYSGAASSNVFVLGPAPENEVARVLGHAARQGLTRVAVVAPQTQYGDLVSAAATPAARQAGAEVVARLTYQRSFQGVQEAIGAGAGEIVAAGADAVLIADGGQALESVAAFLEYHDVSPAAVRYLGTAQWAEGAPERAAPLAGGWFAGLDPALSEDFAQRFQAQTGRRPTAAASLGYDAASAVAQLAAQGGAQPFSRAAVLAAPQFRGATGAFRFGPDGVARRALAVFEVQPGGPVVIDPAPAAVAPAS